MASSNQSLSLGRTQGVLLFWGLVSLCFATGACYYFWKNTENESRVMHLRDEVMNLQSICDDLTAEKKRLQSGNGDAENRLATRETLLQEKEAELSREEARLATLSQKPVTLPSPPQPEADVIGKLNDALHALVSGDTSEWVARGNDQLLRVNAAVFFAPGETTLKPEGKVLLSQIAQALKGQTTGVQLHIESFTDSDAEMKASTDAKPHPSAPWDLTFARAASLQRYFREQATLPPSMVLVVARGDSVPVATTGKDVRTRNRRLEFFLTPAPDASSVPLSPPPDAPVTAKTDK